MGQIRLTISLVLIALFTVALIGFAINFAVDNNAPMSITDDSEMSNLYSNAQGGATNFSTESESQYQSIIETTIAPQSGSATGTGAFAVTPLNVIGIVNNVLRVGYKKIFGTGSGFGIFLTTLIAILLFMIGLYVYKTLRGDPD